MYCTSHHPISVTDVGWSEYRAKPWYRVSMVFFSFFFFQIGCANVLQNAKVLIQSGWCIQYNNYWQGALVLFFFTICLVKQWVA